MPLFDYVNLGGLSEDIESRLMGLAGIPLAESDIQRALDQMRLRAPQYALYANYYDGIHGLGFATAKWRSTFGPLFRNLSDNLCQIVVDAPAERLQVTGFSVEEGASTSTPQDAARLWQTNRMDVRAGFVHREALRAGDAYVLVWPDENGRPQFWPQYASLCTCFYDQEYQGRLLWAAKAWIDAPARRARLNMYYPDRIEKYASTSEQVYAGEIPYQSGSFIPFEADGEPWPVPNPWLEVPLFHFTNNAWISHFGRSELRSVIPLQDALNKTIADQLVAQEFLAFPQRWAVGLDVELDPMTGKAIPPFDPGADRLWVAANENIKFGQFAAADLKQYLEIEEALRIEITRLSALPPHFYQPWGAGGRPPSGESLRAAESRFVKKVEDRQGEFGNIWEDAMELALRMENSATEDARLNCQWEDAASTSEVEELNSVILKEQIGISTEQALREIGYGEADIQLMMADKQAAIDRQRQAFNSGIIAPKQ